jgi:hypothetical protein
MRANNRTINSWLAALGACVLTTVYPVGAEVLRFDWPLPAALTVNAALAKKGNASTAQYRVALSTSADGELALAFRDFEFLTLNGVDARDPKVLARLGPLAALTGSLPTMRLSSSGEYLGTAGLEQMMKGFLGVLPEGLDDAQRERLDDYFRSENVQAMMQQKSGEVWNTWVGAWNGLDLAAGQNLSGTVPVSVLNRTLEQSVLIEHLGLAPETANCPSCVRLRLTTIVEGPEVLHLMSGMMRNLGGEDGQLGVAKFVSARSMSVTEVVTNPSNLMPYYAISNTEVMLRDANDENHSQHDRKEYWFNWE